MVNSKDLNLELTSFGWKDENGIEYATEEEALEMMSESKEDTSEKTQALTQKGQRGKLLEINLWKNL